MMTCLSFMVNPLSKTEEEEKGDVLIRKVYCSEISHKVLARPADKCKLKTR